MKKGRVALILSLLAGAVYLFFYFSRYPVRPVTGAYYFPGQMIELPRLGIDPYMILVILGMVMNLCAVIACTSSLAVGAAVFYGVSIGFYPDSYPCVIVEFLLCLIAAVRMRGPAQDVRSASDGKKPLFSGSLYVLDDSADPGYARQQRKEMTGTLNGKASDYSQGTVIRSLNGKPVKQTAVGKTTSSSVITLIVVISIIAVMVMAVFMRSARFAGTGGEKQFPQAVPAPDLTGYWVTDSKGDTGMCAKIEGDTITVYWLNKDGNLNLYWAGTYDAPRSSDEAHVWISLADKKKMEGAAFASSSDSMIFTWEKGIISYRAALVGSWELTYRLRKTDKVPAQWP